MISIQYRKLEEASKKGEIEQLNKRVKELEDGRMDSFQERMNLLQAECEVFESD